MKWIVTTSRVPAVLWITSCGQSSSGVLTAVSTSGTLPVKHLDCTVLYSSRSALRKRVNIGGVLLLLATSSTARSKLRWMTVR